MIGSLLYLTASHHDIMFTVGACARFQVSLTLIHMNKVKRIFKYLKGIVYLGLWFPKQSNLELVSFCDVNYAGIKIDRKSTSGAYHFLGHCLVTWASKNQNSVALFTTEAKY